VVRRVLAYGFEPGPLPFLRKCMTLLGLKVFRICTYASADSKGVAELSLNSGFGSGVCLREEYLTELIYCPMKVWVRSW
jgi:hypothetical protein